MNITTYPKVLRSKWYLSVEVRGMSVKGACAVFGISRKTYYKWYRIDHDLRTRSAHVPKKRQPNLKLTPDVCTLIRKEKAFTNYGPKKMQILLKHRIGLSVSTTAIYRFYKKHGLVRRPQKRLPWYRPLKDPVIPKKPGEVVQIDTKYVWIDGRRQYQRTFVDICTGYQFAAVLPSLEALATVVAFEAAEKHFPFPILGVQTDNGSENRGVFHQHMGERGIAHYFIPKNSPNWNGAVERAHGVIDQEFYLNPLRPWKTLTEYLRWYNAERIHLGKYLKGLTPAEKLLQYQKEPSRVSPLRVN